jgi:hypothetical protein
MSNACSTLALTFARFGNGVGCPPPRFHVYALRLAQMVFVRIVLDLLAQNRENSSPIHRELIDCCRWNKRAHRKKEVYHQVPYLVWLGIVVVRNRSVGWSAPEQ